MESLPDPPAVADLLGKVAPDPFILDVGSLLWRIFPAEGSHPVAWNELRSFGPSSSRFDHHPPDPPAREHPGFGLLYAADTSPAVFAEYFQATRVINRSLNRPWIVQFALTTPLKLLDVTGGWLLKVGGNAAIASGARVQSRKWSRVFHEAYPDFHGICYRSSLNPAWLAFALYERARPALPSTPVLHAPLTDSRIVPLIEAAAEATGYDVV
ncbi:MAG TPA: RES family NAD+ phosphorylase [Thermoanaerobaculia bacterium]|nr:RES family NAD+ phosphorylase [Thermoanaerobaculia bacterium]